MHFTAFGTSLSIYLTLYIYLTLPIIVSVKYPIEFQSLESLVWVNYLQETTPKMHKGFFVWFEFVFLLLLLPTQG